MKTQVTTPLCTEPASGFPHAQSKGQVLPSPHAPQSHLPLQTALFPPPTSEVKDLSVVSVMFPAVPPGL